MAMASRDRPLHPFVRAVSGALRQHGGVKSGATLVVAVSGGCDSVALLRTLALLGPRRGWRLRLVVGHVQHHLRAQAEADAAFVAELARSLKLEHDRRDIEVPASANLEAAARQARYDALADIAANCGAEAIVVAHHGDDQLETVLMRLLRGASLRGMSGMAWRRRLRPGGPWLLRPMLAVDRAAAESFLRELGQPWCEDHTNADVSRLRARLRAEVTPALRAIAPDAAGRAVRLGQRLREAAAVVDAAVAAAAEQAGDPIHRPWARRLPPAVLSGLLRQRLLATGVPADQLTASCLTPLLRAVRDRRGGTREFHLAGGVTVRLDARFIRIG